MSTLEDIRTGAILTKIDQEYKLLKKYDRNLIKTFGQRKAPLAGYWYSKMSAILELIELKWGRKMRMDLSKELEGWNYYGGITADLKQSSIYERAIYDTKQERKEKELKKL